MKNTEIGMDEVVDRIARQFERGVEDRKQEKPAPVVYESLKPGDTHRQGDVYVTLVSKLPDGAKKAKPQAQLAPGASQGSRHIIAERDVPNCVFYQGTNVTVLDGPIIEARAAWELTHPEHGHAVFPAGIYQIRYQRQYAEELRRVQD